MIDYSVRLTTDEYKENQKRKCEKYYKENKEKRKIYRKKRRTKNPNRQKENIFKSRFSIGEVVDTERGQGTIYYCREDRRQGYIVEIEKTKEKIRLPKRKIKKSLDFLFS